MTNTYQIPEQEVKHYWLLAMAAQLPPDWKIKIVALNLGVTEETLLACLDELNIKYEKP